VPFSVFSESRGAFSPLLLRTFEIRLHLLCSRDRLRFSRGEPAFCFRRPTPASSPVAFCVVPASPFQAVVSARRTLCLSVLKGFLVSFQVSLDFVYLFSLLCLVDLDLSSIRPDGSVSLHRDLLVWISTHFPPLPVATLLRF